jgi:hypothetical protein
MEHPEGTEAARITALAQKFHAIAEHPAVVNWDANALDEWAQVASHGEKLTAQFVLGVWNQWEEWQCGRFDVIAAYGVWDAEHWAAFRTWADKPFTL